MGKTKIRINYSKCGNATGGIDPRQCSRCLYICEPAVFIRHPALKVKEENPYDPQYWQVTPVWLSLCTRCLKCVKACPQNAIAITW